MFPSPGPSPLTARSKGAGRRRNLSAAPPPLHRRGDRAAPPRSGQLPRRSAAQLRLPQTLRDAAEDGELRQDRTSQGEMPRAEHVTHLDQEPAAAPQGSAQRVRPGGNLITYWGAGGEIVCVSWRRGFIEYCVHQHQTEVSRGEE